MIRFGSGRGSTLPELLMAMAVTLAVSGAVFALAVSAGEQLLVQPELHDLQGRLRVAADRLQQDLRMAGAGVVIGAAAGPVGAVTASVLPYRIGESGSDALAGVFHRPDTMSLMYVPATTAQAVIEEVIAAGAGLIVRARPNCGALARDRLCGFRAELPVILFDTSGAAERGTVTAVDGMFVHVEGPELRGRVLPAEGAAIAEVVTAVYLPRETDGVPRMMRYDGRRSTQPAVDHVVAMRFEYYGDATPPAVLPGARLDGPGPWTTYGPRPPEPGRDRVADSWGPGENCVFALVAGVHVPRLLSLGPPGSLLPLTPSMLSDGPWCPDAADPGRFDADLLRIRRVEVVVRLQAAPASLRGPIRALFARPGSSTSPRRWIPDQEVRFSVSPRNLVPPW